MDNLKKIKMFLDTQSPKPKGTCFFKDNLGKKIINKKELDLSIIIPCYNVERYARECIESVLNQKTKFKYEIILINDGSQDNTLNILKDYENKNNVVLINQKNKGFSGARNIGLQYVQGEYLMFVDSDDRLSNGAIENLLSVAYKENYEVVEGRYVLFNEKNILFEEQINEKKCVKPIQDLKGYPWAKVIKSSLFQSLIFPEGYWFEDTIMGFLVYSRVTKAKIINNIVYEYRKNVFGISHTARKNKKSIDSTWITELMIDSLDKFNIDISIELYEFIIKQCLMNYQRVFFLNNKIRKYVWLYQYYMIKRLRDYNIKDKKLSVIKYLIFNKKYNILYFYILLEKIKSKVIR